MGYQFTLVCPNGCGGDSLSHLHSVAHGALSVAMNDRETTVKRHHRRGFGPDLVASRTGLTLGLMKTCAIDSCDQPHVARGWCYRHWRRWRQHGDPMGGRPKLTPDQRFLACFTKTETCWIWTDDRHRYGRFYIDHHRLAAHRWAYQRWVGPIPDGYEVDHLCCVTRCVNPAHLEAVTPQENKRRARLVQVSITHCLRGHEFTVANTYIHPQSGARQCKECGRIRRRRRERARAA